ncbi:hypothetical protein BJF85_14950 [Saccharomonospora sp. CUA-673]|uniref:hypothetical protein n=1 Tax=Saccharomonospora sp. CUA-673 TaxID=1904969 RepID=UPI00095FCBDB|nr:hypothetical protein [Saccharomonospora sp. CUA-673]OLT47692.1 hypothetical protein BJF85_14950 [Saccharomonospora sp. CUA-673]
MTSGSYEFEKTTGSAVCVGAGVDGGLVGLELDGLDGLDGPDGPGGPDEPGVDSTGEPAPVVGAPAVDPGPRSASVRLDEVPSPVVALEEPSAEELDRSDEVSSEVFAPARRGGRSSRPG